MVKLKEDGFDPMVDGAELVGPRVVAAMSIIFNNMDGIDTLTENIKRNTEEKEKLSDANIEFSKQFQETGIFKNRKKH